MAASKSSIYHEVKPPQDYEEFNPDDFLYQLTKTDRENYVLYKTALTNHALLVEMAAQVYGARSTEVKYLSDHKPVAPRNYEKALYSKCLRAFHEYVERRDRNARARQLRQQKQEAAVATLIERGYILGVDFRPNNAVNLIRDLEKKANDERTAEPLNINLV